MKRIFALALVLAMMLSMMVMTASAALPQEAACSLHPDKAHWKYTAPHPTAAKVYSGTIYNPDGRDPESEAMFISMFPDGSEPKPADIGKWWYHDGTLFQKCPGHDPQPQPQPKTGVMDTLPVWFGVMAVSACAYVLTSKRRGF